MKKIALAFDITLISVFIFLSIPTVCGYIYSQKHALNLYQSYSLIIHLQEKYAFGMSLKSPWWYNLLVKYRGIFLVIFFIPQFTGIIYYLVANHDLVTIFEFPSKAVSLAWHLFTIIMFLIVSKYKQLK